MEKTMKYATFRIWRVVVVMAMAALTGWAIYRGNAWIPIPAIIAGGMIIWLTRRREKKEIVDERTYNVAYKASFFILRIFTVAAAGIGVTFIALGRGKYPELRSAGLALAYSCCALLLLYYSAYLYYNSKASGKE
jgi:uncharacterized membrane protein